MMKTLRIKPAMAIGALLMAMSTSLVACSGDQGSETTISSSQSPPREAEAPGKEKASALLAVLLDPAASAADKQATIVGPQNESDEAAARLSETITAGTLAPIETSVVGMELMNEVGTQWSADVMFRSQNPGFPPKGTPITVLLEHTSAGWGVALDSIRAMQQRFEQLAT